MKSAEINNLIGLGFNIAGYGVGLLVYLAEAKRRKMNTSMTLEVALIGVLAGIALATAAQWVYFFFVPSQSPGTFAAGRTIIGGVLGGWIAVEIAKKKLGITQSTGPLWALALPAGEAVGRVGCWFHGCCHGRVCDLPWAMEQHGALRHPTQIYLSLAALASFCILSVLKEREGLFFWAVLLWSVSRIIIEPLRESSSQTPWLAPAICALAAAYCVYRLVKLRQAPARD